jgi:hypothetical protein
MVFLIVCSSLKGESFGVDVLARDARRADVAAEEVGHPGGAADVDLPLRQVGHELEEVVGRHQPISAGGSVVADDVPDGEAALA